MQEGSGLGIALPDGGATALIQLGVLRVLEREGIPITHVAGTSAGALIGAVYATSRDAREAEERILAYLHTPGPGFNIDTLAPLARHATEHVTGLRRLWDRWRDRRLAGFIRGEVMRESLQRLLRGQTFAETRIPFAATALDLEARKPVTLLTGFLADAAYASSAIPGLLAPFHSNGHLLVDGGWAEPVPVEACRRLGPGPVLTLLNWGAELEGVETDRIWALIQADAAARRLLAEAQAAGADVLLRPLVRARHFGDFSDVPGMISAGERAAALALPRIMAALHRPEPHLGARSRERRDAPAPSVVGGRLAIGA